MGEVRLRGACAGRTQDRGWTPASLAVAMFRANLAVSERTLRRGCADGSVFVSTAKQLPYTPLVIQVLVPSIT